jgi:hypothetical protein
MNEETQSPPALPIWQPRIIWAEKAIVIGKYGRVGGIKDVAHKDMALALNPDHLTSEGFKQTIEAYQNRRREDLKELRLEVIRFLQAHERYGDVLFDLVISADLNKKTKPGFTHELTRDQKHPNLLAWLSDPQGDEHFRSLMADYFNTDILYRTPESLWLEAQKRIPPKTPWIRKIHEKVEHFGDALHQRAICNAAAHSPRIYAAMSACDPWVFVGSAEVRRWLNPEKEDPESSLGTKGKDFIFIRKQSFSDRKELPSVILEECEHTLNDVVGFDYSRWEKEGQKDMQRPEAIKFFNQYGRKDPSWAKCDYPPEAFPAEYVMETNYAYESCLLGKIKRGKGLAKAKEETLAELKEALPATYPLFLEYREQEKKKLGEIATQRAETLYEALTKQAADKRSMSGIRADSLFPTSTSEAQR